MSDLKNTLVEMLKGYSFSELESLLNKNTDYDVRDTIMIAMEKYYQEEFYKWLENVN